MRNVSALFLMSVIACGPAVDPDALPPIDETACSKDRIEADGVDSTPMTAIAPGQYLITTTYLRLPLSKKAMARFSELSAPIDADLRANAGLVRVTARLSTACNTARTLTVWKSEADMMKFVTSPSHAKAMAGTPEVSRGGSITTHWMDSEAGATWAKAAQSLGADNDGPIY
jgi:heme-degrading monooxygenase HmoA